MIIQLEEGSSVDLSRGLDISISLRGDDTNPRAWYVDPPKFEPVRANGWIGSVKEGGDVNFRDIFFNPHGHGTHTECLGHITKEVYSINDHLKNFFSFAQLITVMPQDVNGDHIIMNEQLSQLDHIKSTEALIIRTLPNSTAKCSKNYSDTNPPFLSTDCVQRLNDLGVKHLLIDLPSVDKEADNGELAFHHAFWGVPEQPNFERTITELIYVAEHIKDGRYLMNLQVANFENDAAPSRPVLFALK